MTCMHDLEGRSSAALQCESILKLMMNTCASVRRLKPKLMLIVKKQRFKCVERLLRVAMNQNIVYWDCLVGTIVNTHLINIGSLMVLVESKV